MTSYETADFYTDTSLLEDPHAYFDFLRQRGPVTRLPYRNVVAVTGYEEAVQVMRDTEHFSSINAVNGPVPGLPFEPHGDDISKELEAARPQIPFADQVVTQQGQRHTNLRSLLATLFTPTRLRDLEAGLRQTADDLIDEFVAAGQVDIVSQYGGPYATLVIADLLGVVDSSRRKYRALLEGSVPAKMGASPEEMMESPIAEVGKDLFGQIARRRLFNKPLLRWARPLAGVPRGRDILTHLALAKYPDGTTPGLVDLTGLAAFLFGAGQDTTNRLLANSFKVLATRPDIQQALREDPARIDNFVEEILRFDGSVKSGGRMCQKSTTLGGVEIKAGTTILLSHMAANRDPRRFDNPGEFNMDRPRAREHLAFGRGIHTCIGAPLARKEVNISLQRLLARIDNIRLSEAHHGTAGNRHFDYEPTYILRALKSLHLEFDPV